MKLQGTSAWPQAPSPRRPSAPGDEPLQRRETPLNLQSHPQVSKRVSGLRSLNCLTGLIRSLARKHSAVTLLLARGTRIGGCRASSSPPPSPQRRAAPADRACGPRQKPGGPAWGPWGPELGFCRRPQVPRVCAGGPASPASQLSVPSALPSSFRSVQKDQAPGSPRAGGQHQGTASRDSIKLSSTARAESGR